MFASVLVANRGEIARRVFRTARRMGLRTIAVHSEADAGAAHVREADEAVLIGPAAAAESYLRADRILEAARATGAEAIHPGYGFLSENADFAEAVIAAGLAWIGPPAAAIRAMGLKDAAKRRMAEAGVPVTPGYLGDDQSPARLQSEADAIGYPVLIKAVAGGGGKGMRKVERAGDFPAALAAAKREAAASFGDDRVLLETYVARPRHIEVQVFGDRYGNVVHLFERDCSLQRRHQKVIEEAPAPGMDAATRAAVTEAAVRAARAVAYEGAGTVEFIADASDGLRPDRIWFMEMNTRLQVEHPVTEAVTGQDLVEWQLRVAAGEPLPLAQDRIGLNGWAMEARLYAENPATGFLPSTGPLDHFRLPGELRIDAAVEQGDEVTPFYDPMIAKLIAHAGTREAAAAQLAAACRAVEVWPVKTNAGFLARCLAEPDFVAGEVDTSFIEGRLDALRCSEISAAGLAAAGALLAESSFWSHSSTVHDDVWASDGSRLFGFRLNAPPGVALAVDIDGLRRSIILTAQDRFTYTAVASGYVAKVKHGSRIRGTRSHVSVGSSLNLRFIDDFDDDDDGVRWVIFEGGDAFVASPPKSASGVNGSTDGDGQILSPMPGKIVSVAVAAGEPVAKGQILLTLEAMKMEHALAAPFDGVVAALNAEAGAQVSEGVLLARLEPKAD